MAEERITPEEFDLEKVPALIKRCPKCHSLSLEYDKGRIRCTKCGFEQDLSQME